MNSVCVVFLKKNWMLCNVVNGSTFLRERKRKSTEQHAEMRNKYIKRSGFGRRALEQNILIHGKGYGIDSWSILVDVTMTALFKTHNINE